MTKITRQQVIERALLITMFTRDMETCAEGFCLYNSATIVLEKNSEAYAGNPTYSESTLNLLGRIITLHWCATESITSPFTVRDLRKSIGNAMSLAKKELIKERTV